MTRERSVDAACADELDKRGAWHMKIHGSGLQKRGAPDRLACYRGTFVAIETKTQGGRLSASQRVELRRIEQAGGIAVVARSRADLVAALNEIDAARAN